MSNPIFNVYSMLHDDSGVKSIVDDRIYTPIAEQTAAAPYIVWQLISMTPYSCISGGANSDHQTMQIDAYADSDEDARKLIFACRDALSRGSYIARGPDQMSITLDTEIFRWSMDVDYVYERVS